MIVLVLFVVWAVLLNFGLFFFFRCLKQQNRPLNSQNVADALQKFNLKKASIQKSLDVLADSGKISFKEYGKQKIYLARQDQFSIPNNEELAQMKGENSRLQRKLDEQKRAVSEVEGGNSLLNTEYSFYLSKYQIILSLPMLGFKILLSLSDPFQHL